jgi:hypothetical protein
LWFFIGHSKFQDWEISCYMFSIRKTAYTFEFSWKDNSPCISYILVCLESLSLLCSKVSFCKFISMIIKNQRTHVWNVYTLKNPLHNILFYLLFHIQSQDSDKNFFSVSKNWAAESHGWTLLKFCWKFLNWIAGFVSNCGHERHFLTIRFV